MYALMLAVLVPLVCYFIIKRYSESAIVMPGHYLADSTIAEQKREKDY